MADPEDPRRLLKTADHLVYVTYPIIKESKVLIKALDEIGESLRGMINLILKRENERKMVKIYPSEKDNLETFIKISKSYGISPKLLNDIFQIIELSERRKKSPMEFSRKDKFVMMHETLRTESVSVEDLKRYLCSAKELLKIADSAGIFSPKT